MMEKSINDDDDGWNHDYDGDISVCFNILIFQDDSESQRADHKSMVRGFNAASSNTLARYMFWLVPVSKPILEIHF